MKPRSWNIHFIACFLGIGGFVFGLDTGAIGPVIVMPQFLATAPSFRKFENHIIQGVLVAVVSLISLATKELVANLNTWNQLLLSAAISSSFAGTICDRISRKRAITLGAMVTAVGSTLEAGSIHIAMMLIGRLLSGGMRSPISLYICSE